MTPDEMLAYYRRHRAAEDARDFDTVMETLVPDCVIEHVSLGLRTVGREASKRGYEEWFGAFSDLGPIPEGIAFGDDVLVAFGQLHGTMTEPWLGLKPTGRSHTLPIVNIVGFRDGLMVGERLFYDVATMCDQLDLELDALRAAAADAST